MKEELRAEMKRELKIGIDNRIKIEKRKIDDKIAGIKDEVETVKDEQSRTELELTFRKKNWT